MTDEQLIALARKHGAEDFEGFLTKQPFLMMNIGCFASILQAMHDAAIERAAQWCRYVGQGERANNILELKGTLPEMEG